MQQTKWAVILVATLAISLAAQAQTFTRIFVVRHADRQVTDDLNALGVVRADELKRVLLQTGIDSVYSTNFVRTKKTVQPLATAEGLPVIIYDDIPLLLKRILKYKNKTLLVAGHSNTVPQIIKSCGCLPPFLNIPDTQFDNLFLLIVQHPTPGSIIKNNCKLLHMKYGAVTN